MFTPTILNLLEYLRNSQAERTGEELSSIINESPKYVNKALERLVAMDMVTKEGGAFLYKATPRSEGLLVQLREVYEAVAKKPEKELLIRGIICHIPPQYLFHFDTLVRMLEGEGIGGEEAKEFLGEEMERGYLKKVRIIYMGIDPYPAPLYIPPFYYYYLCHLGIIDKEKYQQLKEKYKDYELQEEDYLICQYPPELANPAKEYIRRERAEIRDRLRQKGLLSWWGGFR